MREKKGSQQTPRNAHMESTIAQNATTPLSEKTKIKTPIYIKTTSQYMRTQSHMHQE